MLSSTMFDQACQQIKEAYASLEHSQGWQFLTSPKSTCTSNVDIAFFTPMPLSEYHPRQLESASSEQGSIFTTEQWQSYATGRAPLQKQVQAMFRQFARLFYCAGDALLQRSLSAHYIPFRADNPESLNNPEASREFAFKLWQQLLPKIAAKVVICIDDITATDLYQILTNESIKQAEPEIIMLNWGSVRAKIYHLPEDAPSKVLVRLPQLSRFTIFDREKSQAAVNELITLLHPILSSPTQLKVETRPAQPITPLTPQPSALLVRPVEQAAAPATKPAAETIKHNSDSLEDEIQLSQQAQAGTLKAAATEQKVAESKKVESEKVESKEARPKTPLRPAMTQQSVNPSGLERNQQPEQAIALYADEADPIKTLVLTAIEVVVCISAAIALISYVLR